MLRLKKTLKLEVILCFQFLTLLASCQTQSSITLLRLSYKSDFQIAPAYNQDLYFRGAQIYPWDENILTFIDQNSHKIRFWKLDHGVFTDSIYYNYHNLQLWGYKFLSKDSILLSFNPTYINNFHDSVKFIINRNNKKLDNFSFVGAPVPMLYANKNIEHKSGKFYYLCEPNFPVIYDHTRNAVFSVLDLFSGTYYPANGNAQNFKAGWSYDNGESFKQVQLDFYEQPSPNEYFFTFQREMTGAYDGDSFVMIGIGSSPTIIKYNLKTNKVVKKADIEFAFVKPQPAPNSAAAEELNQLEINTYYTIKYDRYTKTYWRIAQMKNNPGYASLLKNYPIYEIVQFDANLNKIAEGVLPFGSKRIIPYKGGLLVFNKYESVKKNRLILDWYGISLLKNKNTGALDSMIVKERNKAEYPAMTRNNYLNQLSDHKNFDNYLLVPLSQTCTSCLEEFGERINSILNTKSNSKLAVILFENNPTAMSAFLKKYGLENHVGKDIFFETNGNVYMNIASWTNFKLIHINNDSFKEKNYEAIDDLPKMYSKLMKL
jgi:hypothetical protein